MATWSCSGNLRVGTLTGWYAQTHENFKVSGFRSVPESSERLGATRRQGQYAVNGSGARGGCYLR
jgi:hypothetical protein